MNETCTKSSLNSTLAGPNWLSNASYQGQSTMWGIVCDHWKGEGANPGPPIGSLQYDFYVVPNTTDANIQPVLIENDMYQQYYITFEPGSIVSPLFTPPSLCTSLY